MLAETSDSFIGGFNFILYHIEQMLLQILRSGTEISCNRDLMKKTKNHNQRMTHFILHFSLLSPITNIHEYIYDTQSKLILTMFITTLCTYNLFRMLSDHNSECVRIFIITFFHVDFLLIRLFVLFDKTKN